MAPKRPKLTLLDARSSRTGDLVERLIDAPNVTAASIIRQLDRHQVDLALLHIVSSVHERWRVRGEPLPLPASDEATEKSRRIIGDMLTASPELIVPALLALSDATAAHDPRRRTIEADAA